MKTSTTDHRNIQAGTISGIEDHGTIIVVRIKTEEGWDIPVFFEHRPFQWMLQAEDCDVEELIGRQASYDGETFHFSA